MLIDPSPPLVLGLLVHFLETWQVVVLGLVITLVALNMRFEWLLTCCVVVLACAEFHYQPEAGLSLTVRQMSRLLRWFLFLAMALKGVSLALRGSGMPTRPHAIRGIAVAILVLAFATIAYSWDRHVTAAAGLLLALVFFCAFGVMWRLIDSRERVVGVAHALYRAYWPLIVASMLLYPQEIRDNGFLTHRYAGIFLNPNGMGVLAAVFFPLTLWEVYRSKRGIGRMFAIFVLLCSLMAVLASGSRSAAVGILISGTIFLFHRYGVAFPIFVTTVVLLVIGYAVAGGTLDLVDEAFTPDDSEIVFVQRGLDPSNRFEKWQIAWDYLDRNAQTLLLGYGYGCSRIVPLNYRPGAEIWSSAGGLSGMDFHSSHLQTWMEMGIPGVILVEALLVTILISGLNFFRGRSREELPMVGVALFASLVVMIGDTVVHGWLFSPGSGMSFLFWCYTALVVRATQFLDAERDESEDPAPAPEPMVAET